MPAPSAAANPNHPPQRVDRARRVLIGLGLAGLIGTMVAWNFVHLHGAAAIIREKDLSFLPSPEVAKLLCLGQRNSVAKLRWIDSFAYFEYQLNHHDDHLAGSPEGGVVRLYNTLIALDPRFEPFYEQAVLNTSGVLGNHGAALSFLMQGLEVMPERSELWRITASLLITYFHWQERAPQCFSNFLSAWREAETTAAGKLMILNWQLGMARRQLLGFEQLPYWFEQLRAAPAGTPIGDFVEASLRQQLATYGQQELNALADDYRIEHNGLPERIIDLWQDMDLLDPLALVGSPPAPRLDDLLDGTLVHHRYAHGLPPFGPLRLRDNHLILASDPYGLPWHMEDGRVVSLGLQRRDFTAWLGKANANLLAAVRAAGHWPSTLAEVVAMGVALRVPPGGHLDLRDQELTVTWSVPAGQPWPLR